MDANKTHGEKTKWELHKNAMHCFEQTTIQQPLTSNLTNHPSKTNKSCWTLLEKQDEFIKDIYKPIFAHQELTLAPSGHQMQSRGPARSDGQ